MQNIEPEGAELVQGIAQRWLHETDLVPLSVLALDHPEPIGGWPTALEARGVELLEDDLLRPSITRSDARKLAQERRDWERSTAEKARRRQEQMAAPRPVAIGVPPLENGTPVQALMAAPGYVSVSAEFGRGGVHQALLDEQLVEPQRQRREEIAARKAAKEAKRLLEEK